MQEIIHKLDNWTIVKLLGGITLILTALIGFFSKYYFNKITQADQYNYDKKLEDIKGEINKSNSILNSVIQNYLSSSQKLLDKKIQAYDLLWSCIIDLKDKFPAGIALVYQIFPDNWFDESKAFNELNNNPNLGPVFRSYNMDTGMQTFVDIGKVLMPSKPYLSDKSYKLFYTYQGLIGRISHKFIFDYQKDQVYNWKNDKPLETILKIILTEKELEYIKEIKLGALTALTDLLEYKILQDLRISLNLKETTGDTIAYLKDIEQILSATKK